MTRKFIDYAHMGTCEVCGKSAPVVVVSSRLGPCSCAYCEDCYDADLESYPMIVSTVWSCGWENMTDWAKARIRKILTKLGKTEEEMLADVKQKKTPSLRLCKTMKNIVMNKILRCNN